MTIPASAHYGPAHNRTERCGTCTYYTGGRCSMWEDAVDAGHTCDEWAKTKAADAAALNEHAAGVRDRVAELIEPRLARHLEIILTRVAGQAARNFRSRAASHLLAAGRPPTQAMIALYPRPEEASVLAAVGSEPPDELHVTLIYFDHSDVAADPGSLEEAVRAVAASHEPLVGKVGGIGAFQGQGERHPSILIPNVPGLVELQQAVTSEIEDAGYQNGSQHGFNPHITVDWTDDPQPPGPEALGEPLHFDGLAFVPHDGQPRSFPLGAPVTASTGDWTAPDPAELMDVAALVASLRTKTDAVRLEVAKLLLAGPLDGLGLSFDVTNPFAAAAVTSRRVTEIGDTTRAQLMQIIRESYQQGLSIDDTAKAIRSVMTDAAGYRSRMIARTEMVGAMNGGSTALMQLVGNATGTSYTKTWLTAPGAEYPRHEDYDGLDGQTVGLEEPFDVGGEALMYPGDPDGSPDEVCNCRCTVTYGDGSPAETAD